MAIQRENDQQGLQELRASAQLTSDRLFKAAISNAGGQLSDLDSDLITERAKIYRSAKDLKTSFDLLSSITSPIDETIQEYIDLAHEHATSGDRDAAIKILKKSVAIAKKVPYYREGYNVDRNFSNLTIAFAELGEADLAISTLSNVKGDGNETFWINTMYEVVSCLAEHGFEQDAVDLVTEFKEEEEKEGALSFIAQALITTGNEQAAQKYLDQVSPHGRVRILMASADRYVEQGNIEKAKELTRQSANILNAAAEGYTIMWQSQLVDTALESLDDPVLALSIAAQMPSEYGTITRYTAIAEYQASKGNKEDALSTLQQAEVRATEILEKAQVEDSRLKADADIADAYLSLGLFEGEDISTQEQQSPTEKAEELIKNGQNEEAIGLIDQELVTVTTPSVESGEEYVKWARELHYSIETIAKLYQQAGVEEKARETIAIHFRIVSTTRDHKNKHWYYNSLGTILQEATTYNHFDVAEQVINEIAYPPLKSYANVETAEAYLQRGNYEECTRHLKTAEDGIAKIEKDDSDLRRRCLLEISNGYKRLEVTLLAA